MVQKQRHHAATSVCSRRRADKQERARGGRLSPLHRYVIGPGDVLQITVAKEPDASVASVVVRPDE